MKKILTELLDLIYKKKCYLCGSSKEAVKICSSCYKKIEHLKIYEYTKIKGIKVYCCAEYTNDIQKIIRGIKYHKQKDLAYYQAKFMFEYWEKIPDKFNNYEVLPVPLFKKREQVRKYNHMNLIAEEFCKLSGYKLNTKFIKRIKDTKPQYKLNRQQRMNNLANAFIIDKSYQPTDKIIIIDDICTTGSTFESIISELQKNSINDIVCLATTTPVIE